MSATHRLRRERQSHALRELLTEEPPELEGPSSWWACGCGSWHHVTDVACPDE